MEKLSSTNGNEGQDNSKILIETFMPRLVELAGRSSGDIYLAGDIRKVRDEMIQSGVDPSNEIVKAMGEIYGAGGLNITLSARREVNRKAESSVERFRRAITNTDSGRLQSGAF